VAEPKVSPVFNDDSSSEPASEVNNEEAISVSPAS